MGSMKEHMMDLQEARFLEWAAEHYPDVSPDTPEWEQIGNYYSWEQEAREEQFIEEMYMARYEEDIQVKASLESIEARYNYALSEIAALEDLLKARQPELVWRMGVVHSVFILDAFLMYCARALLNHDWPLEQYKATYFMEHARMARNKKTEAAAMDISLFRPVARNVVSAMTFQNHEVIEKYFSTVLHFQARWPLHPLKALTEFRNDLGHRNGHTKQGVRVQASSIELRSAITVIRSIIESAIASLRLEQEFFSNERTEEEKEFVRTAIGGVPFAGDKA
ncbi:MAG: hypothetical protein E6556_07005 [Pantoea sp.]|nr:hypothetical protein [Pantoea sp.]